jgi:hypothetical protein
MTSTCSCILVVWLLLSTIPLNGADVPKKATEFREDGKTILLPEIHWVNGTNYDVAPLKAWLVNYEVAHQRLVTA